MKKLCHSSCHNADIMPIFIIKIYIMNYIRYHTRMSIHTNVKMKLNKLLHVLPKLSIISANRHYFLKIDFISVILNSIYLYIM